MDSSIMEVIVIPFAILLIIALSLIVCKHQISNTFDIKNLPPGNTGWPLIGESIGFLTTGRKGQLEKFIFDRMSKYSNKVFKTSLFCEPAAVFCGVAGNNFLFSNENKLAEALQRYIGIMEVVAQRHFAFDWDNKRQVTVFPLAKMYTFSLACRLFLSMEDREQVEKLAKSFDFLASAFIAIPIDLPGTSFNRGIKASNLVRKELLKIIKQRKTDPAENKASQTPDILSHMLTTVDDKGQFMSEMEIADKILGLLIGGHDTASSAITFVVKYLAEMPQVYEKALEEQMGIAKSKVAGELLNWEDIQKMKYSWKVACEVMRLAPPLQGAFREAITDFTYADCTIPKGWKLYWSANSTHRNPERFPDPEKFDPSRFDGLGPAPYTFVPFGGGPRMCLLGL
ncbi:hypothetical protein JCGZ_20978 [Jatropha curcas]|uniref:Uncharacterized protein n=1 Tax=Jatropha curcas TaxID=180498 RepID=A0A067JW35_JATCU|nr:hypothetical protein JCGZ_20978 [Jatropha curcas]